MCKMNFRTDMADERVDVYKSYHNLSEIDGIKVTKSKNDVLNTVIVDILNEKGSRALNKEIGKYITIELNSVQYLENKDKEKIQNEVANNISLMIEKNVKSVMVVGLGNSSVTPDSLGPKVVSYINVTRHMLKYAKDLIDPNTRQISAVAPSVMGKTGIETEEIIEAITKFVKPDLLIVIDSLASLSTKRLGKTIQIGNTGIVPGAGVGNKRSALNKESLGIDVIAIGVPFVVDIATITSEIINKVINSNSNLNQEVISLCNKEHIEEILKEDNLMVTPKEIDELVFSISEIIANALNIVL